MVDFFIKTAADIVIMGATAWLIVFSFGVYLVL